MMPWEVPQRMRLEHIPQVAALERATFSDPWSEKAFELLLGEDAIGVVICDYEGNVAAYGSMLWAPDEGQIINIAVSEECRRRGYGKAILDFLRDAAVEKSCTQLSLEVRVSNIPAISLYTREGFAVAGRRKNFYTNPREDAFVMICELSLRENETNKG